MTLTRRIRTFALGPILVSGLAAGGCMSGPTYGTDKTSTQQLVDDLSGIASIAPKPKPKIDYSPRPELVRPASTATLPAPQEDIVASGNPAWPESPEQKRAKIRAYATENRDKQGYEPLVVSDVPAVQVTSSSPEKPGQSARGTDAGVYDGVKPEQTAAYRAAAAQTKQGSDTDRKYLSEPPLVYRTPEATAATGELGEDESKKERRKRREAMKGSRMSEWIPDILQ
ncbi:MAG: hypothetical protein JNL61_07215 [Rhizobiaceae bacterium]|nr:hypothetical protein [Rhizobiaceae bacterium]